MMKAACPATCRWLTILRSGAAVCSRWGERVKLKQHREADPWGEPQWIPRRGCEDVWKAKREG